MRCPYCGGLNPDTTRYCVRCGRDVAHQKPPAQRQTPIPANPRPPMPQQAPVYRPPQPGQGPYVAPVATPPQQRQQAPYRPVQPMPQPAAPPRPAEPQTTTTTRRRRPATVSETPLPEQPIRPTAPEPPAPFPPKNIEHLRALADGALPYSLVSDTKSYGKKRVVRIAYPPCASWQQVATLLATLKQFDESKFETIVIQGVHENEREAYLYTNGQLVFDRNARLGNQILKRYQIETENGYASSSIRVVLSE